ncbi:MAG: HAD family hydrolase, partial [Synechococcaceae bacterium WB9_2_170]|nr:HAD family hydrolase [Synechococcaceae bacterium WB9_2_170]
KQAHYRQRLAEGPLPLRPGVERLLLEAQAAGLRQALVTTSGRSAVEALLQPYPQLQSCFELWVCGEDVAAKKPHPEGYERALAALGISAGSAIAMAAARGAGLAVVISGWAAGENSLTGDGSLAGAALVVDHLDAGDGGPVTVASLGALLPWRTSNDKAAPAINPIQWPAATDR